MKSVWRRILMLAAGAAIIVAPTVMAQPVPYSGDPWGQRNRDIQIGNLWDQVTNRNFGGFNNALVWPGGWAGDPSTTTPRRTYANYKGYVLGAKNVHDPQFPDVVWPYMVGQRDGWNDGERGESIRATPPDPAAVDLTTQILQKGRLDRRTFRQANAVVTVDGVNNNRLNHVVETRTVPELVGDEADGPYQDDVIDPTIPADMTVETYAWTRMGVGTNRMVYAFVDRDNDDYMFWHWRNINDGIWGRLGVDKVDCCGGTHGTVEGVLLSFMFQWDRNGPGAYRTASAGEASNDAIWHYYGADYDGARTEDMRLVWIQDGDQDPSKYNPAHGKQDDVGDPDPTTGELWSAKTGGWQILHYDVSGTDKNDDPAQPRTIGWRQYNLLIRTGTPNDIVGAGHEAKYKQMEFGYEGPDQYYAGDYPSTTGRGDHPFAALGASWIKASNDPATADQYWGAGKILGIDLEITDIEQQAGFGPDDMAPGDTVNGIYALGMGAISVQDAQMYGGQWLRGEIDDAAKNAIVWGTKDSLFKVMRQAKAVYESKDFGGRFASTRSEFEDAMRAAVTAGELTLSPPAPATLNVASGNPISLSWTLNTSVGSDIAGWRVYRTIANGVNDSAWVLVKSAAAAELSWQDTDVSLGISYYYYLTTVDAQGNESTMHTRTDKAAVADIVAIRDNGRPLSFSLSQNAPNPFNPETVIRLTIEQAGHTRLDVYNVNGQLVRTLVNGTMSAGSHEVTWNGTDNSGHRLASGTYIYRLSSDDKVHVRRMTIAR